MSALDQHIFFLVYQGNIKQQRVAERDASYCNCSLVCPPVQGGPKSDTPLVFEFPLMSDAVYLEFLFTHVSLSLNDVVLCLPM